MSTVVFLGPSLPLDEARQILPDARFLPPVAQGDLLSLLAAESPEAIGIIDGVFYMAPPVWHKEILYALERGIPVYGASSMGALRAAECDRFGMVGVGEVYRRFAAGELTDDDEVALMHGDAQVGWVGSSEPLVNVRATLEAEVAAGRLSETDATAVIAGAKALWFPDRRRAAILDAARANGVSRGAVDVVDTAFDEGYVDVKRDDARALLERLRDRDPDERPAPFAMDRSIVFLAFADRDRQVTHGGLPVRLEEIKRHVAVEHPAFPSLLDRALDRLLVAELARVWAVEPSEADVAAELARLRWRLGIADGEETLARWRSDNDLSEDELDQLLTREATARRLRTWARIREDKRALVRPILDELRLRGEYVEWASRAARTREDASAGEPHDALAGKALVGDHIRATGWRPDPPLGEFAEHAAFADLTDLVEELRVSEQARHARRQTFDVLDSLLDPDGDGP